MSKQSFASVLPSPGLTLFHERGLDVVLKNHTILATETVSLTNKCNPYFLKFGWLEARNNKKKKPNSNIGFCKGRF